MEKNGRIHLNQSSELRIYCKKIKLLQSKKKYIYIYVYIAEARGASGDRLGLIGPSRVKARFLIRGA